MCPSAEQAPGSTGKVVLRGATRATEVYLVDSALELHEGGLERLEAIVPAGIYQARFQLGDAFEDRVFRLEAGAEKAIDGPHQVAVSAAPLACTRPRWAEEGAPGARRQDFLEIWDHAAKRRPEAGEGVLHVLLRSGPGVARSGAHVRVSTPGSSTPAARLEWHDLPGLRMATACLPAGIHLLSVGEGETWLCRSIPVAPGQQTVLSMEIPSSPEDERHLLVAVLESSLLVAPCPAKGDDGELLVQELAQQALRRSRALMGPLDLRDGESFSPFAALLGAHGLVEARRARMPQREAPVKLTPEEAEAVGAAYRRLRGTWLSGSADVAVLGLLVGRRPPPVNLDVPPLLMSTWRTLVSVSLKRRPAVRGGNAALRVAEGMVGGSAWVTWMDREGQASAGRPRRNLDAGVRDLLEPELRPTPGRLPSWVETRETGELVAAWAPSVAQGLQLPLPLVLKLASNLAKQRAARRLERGRQRVRALGGPGAKVCLVVLPDGVRVAARGQPIDFDAVFEDLLDGAAANEGLVAVRAPPAGLGLDAGEVRESLRQADVMVADLTFEDPSVMATVGAWLFKEVYGAREKAAARLVLLRSAEHSAAPRPSALPGLVYQASYGTGLAFEDLAQARRALQAATRASSPAPADRRRRAWLRGLARAERQRLQLRELAARVRRHLARGRPREAAALLRRRLPGGALRRAASSVQLDAFLLCRAFGDWKGMLRVEGEMRPSLRRTLVVREQRALALKWSGTRRGLDQALRLLRSVLDEVGLNGATCSLLGSIHKARWMATTPARRAEKARRLDEAIDWYRRGADDSPLDPCPGVNLLTLLAARGTDSAMAEHGRRLPQVEQAALRRLSQRPSYWDLATMMELAANRCDHDACDLYLRMALAAPHEPWQLRTAATNLRILLEASAASFRSAGPWLRKVIRSLVRWRPAVPGEGE